VSRSATSRGPDADPQGSTIDENVAAINAWEQATLRTRTRAEQLSDWVAATAGSGPIMLAHLVGFTFWIAANTRLLPGIPPFDPFPFPLLTLIVSLEAIFLALFVLASQNRLARQADQRSELDLQIDLLAEREMTVVLRLLHDIATHLDVATSVTPEQLRDLARTTDVRALMNRMADLPGGAALPSGRRDERG
jgi:uncharacterized membrane protein